MQPEASCVRPWVPQRVPLVGGGEARADAGWEPFSPERLNGEGSSLVHAKQEVVSRMAPARAGGTLPTQSTFLILGEGRRL